MAEKENFKGQLQVRINHTRLDTYLAERKIRMKTFYKIKDFYMSSLNYLFMNLKKFFNSMKNLKCKIIDSYKLNDISKEFFENIGLRNKFVLSSDIKLSNNSEFLILNPKITIENEITDKISFYENKIKFFQSYYQSLLNNKLDLFDEKFYLSAFFRKEDDKVKNILDFDNQIKLSIYDYKNFTMKIVKIIETNSEITQKYILITEILLNENLNLKKKHRHIYRLLGIRNYKKLLKNLDKEDFLNDTKYEDKEDTENEEDELNKENEKEDCKN